MSASSDQYSLAITYCKIRGGTMPFIGNAAEIMAGHCNRLPELSMIPLHQRWVVGKALEKNPLKRWGSCSEFIRQIRQSNSNPIPPVPTLDRRTLFTAIVLGFGLVGIALFARAFLGRNQSPTFKEFILEGHRGEVGCLSISEDGKTGISGGKDKKIIAWDLENQKAKFIFNDHTKSILSVALSQDGQKALSGGALLDNRVILWDLAKGEKVREMIGHVHGVKDVRFLPDGKRAISCSLDCTARLWDLETGTQIHFFEEMATYDPRNMQYGSPRQVWHMDVSEDGKTMVCCLRDGRICVHDVDSGKRIQTLNGPEQFYNSLSINRDATFAITAFGGTSYSLREPIDLKIMRWDLLTTKREFLMETESAVVALFSPKGANDLFVFPRKGSPFLFDLNTKSKTDIFSQLGSEVNFITGNDKGTILLLGCNDFTVRLLKRN
jgi:WD40 repeat protein